MCVLVIAVCMSRYFASHHTHAPQFAPCQTTDDSRGAEVGETASSFQLDESGALGGKKLQEAFSLRAWPATVAHPADCSATLSGCWTARSVGCTHCCTSWRSRTTPSRSFPLTTYGNGDLFCVFPAIIQHRVLHLFMTKSSISSGRVAALGDPRWHEWRSTLRERHALGR